MIRPLITRDEIAKFRQLSKTPNNDKLNEIIRDAQLLDLQPLLGERLYNKLTASPAEHEELMTGSIYEYDGISYTNYGLKMVLAYFTYARYIMFSSVTDTPFSVVEKLNSDSRPIEASTKKTIYSLNRDAAMQLWENVRNYLLRTEHPDFKPTKTESSGGMRFTKIA